MWNDLLVGYPQYELDLFLLSILRFFLDVLGEEKALNLATLKVIQVIHYVQLLSLYVVQGTESFAHILSDAGVHLYLMKYLHYTAT